MSVAMSMSMGGTSVWICPGGGGGFGMRDGLVYHVSLFGNHRSELAEDAAELGDGRLNRFYRLASLLDVRVLRLGLLHDEQLLVADWVQGQEVGAGRGRPSVWRSVQRRRGLLYGEVGGLRDGRDEVVCPRPRRLDVLGPHFQHVLQMAKSAYLSLACEGRESPPCPRRAERTDLEVGRDVRELSLEEEDDIGIVLALLVALRVERPGQDLQARYILSRFPYVSEGSFSPSR